MKHLLGVKSRSTNWAGLSETNSNPILCKIILKVVRYWERIKESASPILKAVLIKNKQLQKEGKPSWLTGIGIMTEIFRVNDMSPLTNLGNLTSTTLKKLLDDEWHLNQKKHSEGKLKFYTNIKERPGFSILIWKIPNFGKRSQNFELVHTNFQYKLVDMKIRLNVIRFASCVVN